MNVARNVSLVVAALVAPEAMALAQQPQYAPAPYQQPYGQPAPMVPPGQPGPYGAPQYNAPSAYGPQNSTAAQLQDAERSDSGRGLEIAYAQASIGAAFVGLDALSNSKLGLNKTSEGGPVVGLGAGLRLLFFTVGARARVTALSGYDFWQLDLEAGYHVPIGRWDPYVSLHGGYAFETGADGGQIPAPAGAGATFSSTAADQVALHGGEVGVSGGVDYYVTPLLSIGADATAEALFLARPKLTAQDAVTSASASSSPLYTSSGSSVGLGLSASLHAGLHFGS